MAGFCNQADKRMQREGRIKPESQQVHENGGLAAPTFRKHVEPAPCAMQMNPSDQRFSCSEGVPGSELRLYFSGVTPISRWKRLVK